MGKSSRPRLSDIRHAYRLVSEVVELGHDPTTRNSWVVASLGGATLNSSSAITFTAFSFSAAVPPRGSRVATPDRG